MAVLVEGVRVDGNGDRIVVLVGSTPGPVHPGPSRPICVCLAPPGDWETSCAGVVCQRLADGRCEFADR